MSRVTGGIRAEVTEWTVEQFRLTTFHSPFGKGDGWWEKMTNQEPESSVTRKSGERADIGLWEGLTLIISVKPQEGRIDWVACEPVTEAMIPPQLTERLPSFVGLADRWLMSDLLPNAVNRMAFGLVTHLPVLNLEEGNRRLSDYLPFDVDGKTSTDFLYQVNRPRESKSLPGKTFNRLMKWSVGLFFLQHLRLSGNGLTLTTDPSSQRCGCRLELDINTTNEEGHSLPQNKLNPIFTEMVALAEEIVREGDIQ